jgi:hypothetical protein
MNGRMSIALLLLVTLGGLACVESRGVDSQSRVKTISGYKVASRVRAKAPLSALLLRIWITRPEPSKAEIIRLTKILKAKYSNETRLQVLIFDSKKEADDFSDLYEFAGHSYWRAKYWLDRNTKDEYVEYCEQTKEPCKKIQRIDLKRLD